MSQSAASDNAPSGIIRLRLRELAQLFNSMDPSPFRDRDLDPDAEDFIVGRARELPPTEDLVLVIHLATPLSGERAGETEEAVRNHFTERTERKRREFRLLMRQGRVSLLVGLLFLTICLMIGNLLKNLGATPLAGILQESFIIGGWVAMWRPLEIYLYDWWPLRAEYRVLSRLSRMQVRIMPLQ
ncbi:MAG: hypothetical protein PHQ04_09485 [Opitutaceae bacterium]|nr:hypothetical protein [Opitutaceae bacterium]